jgi:hypothetical protein
MHRSAANVMPTNTILNAVGEIKWYNLMFG